MTIKKSTYRLTISGLVIGLGLVWGFISYLPDRSMHLVACDVGQGDAILIFQGSNQVLVDGGPNNQVIDCLSRHLPFWDRTIEVVVLTHAQADHMNGLIAVLERFDVEQIVANGIVNDTAGFWEFRDAVVNEGAEIHLPKQGDKIKLSNILLEVLWPSKKQGSDIVWEESSKSNVLGLGTHSGEINESSVALKLTIEEFDALLTGDMGLDTEQALIRDGVLTDVEFLKVGHHGSKYASSSEFLREISPEIAVISVGKKNWYGHPTSDTLMRLDGVGAKVFRTDELGDVEVVSDGEKYWVE
jgi:competence protein ComEC